MKAEDMMADYRKLLFGGNYEIVRVENSATGIKGHGAESNFVFLQELSGKIITQPSTTKKRLPRKIKKTISPVSDHNRRVRPDGYMRRGDAAKYLGISMRTLTNWQQRGIIPVVHVGNRITLFRTDDLDRSMSRFTIQADGNEAL